MVQKEVKKKTTTYALVAILSAAMLITLIYTFGAGPLVYPPSQMPAVTGMKTFSSVQDIVNYLNANTESNYHAYGGGPLDSKFFGIGNAVPTAIPAPAMAGPLNGLGRQGTFSASTGAENYDMYSTTNVQVAGVDEADTVKTDGKYIYTLSSTQNSGGYYGYGYSSQGSNVVYILNADPQNPQVVSKITLEGGTEPAGLFLSSDGSKLVVLASKYQYYGYGGDMPAYPPSRTGGIEITPSPMLSYGAGADVYTYINVYDVSDKASPVLTRNFTASGSYFNSRMIGNNVYAVVSQPAQVIENTVVLPAVFDGKTECDASPSSIYYADMNQTSYCTFTSFYGLDIMDDAAQPTNMTVMMGGASIMYVSQSNIYVTYPNWENNGQYTDIYRVSIDGLQLNLQAQGAVPGTPINQYSMDEYDGYFRIATNWQDYSQWQMQQASNVYVLNPDMAIVGRLEGLAQNENLHSTRFMGDKLYLVTFKKTDPFFVIDLSQPANPQVKGELKIPGYSDYLHPYDDSHIIGVGKETVDASDPDSNFAWYQGIKLSLFDVSDPNNPSQLSKYVIGDRGTDSLVLTEPKAFLFDKRTGLLVIPVNLAMVDEATRQQYLAYANSTDKSGYAPEVASAYGTDVWQGVYVFTLTVDGGFALKGTVTHLDPSLLNSQGQLIEPSNYYSSQNDFITRAFYIGNTLYTVSNDKVKLNSLADMWQIAEIDLT